MNTTWRRLALVVSGALWLCGLPAPTAARGASLAGWTLSDDGRPLAGVEVIVACPPGPVSRTVSDGQGRFELVDLRPGNCLLRGHTSGYVDAIVEGDPGVPGGYGLRVLAETRRDGFELRLTRGAFVSGRITDARGEPASRIRVHLIRREMTFGLAKLSAVPYGPVDASGSFKAGAVPPGEYYVGATPMPEGNDAGGNRGNAATYFPGTEDSAAATTFTLKPGESKRVEFALLATRAFRVPGVVRDSAGRAVAGVSMSLAFAEMPSWLMGSTRTAADGSFAFTGVQPGQFDVDAKQASVAFGRVVVEIRDGDVEHLVVVMAPRR